MSLAGLDNARSRIVPAAAKHVSQPRERGAAHTATTRIGQKIRFARHDKNISQTELGTAIGVTFQQVQKYENGKNRVSAGRLKLIAEVLGQPIDYFYQDHAAHYGQANADTMLTPLFDLVVTNGNAARIFKAVQAIAMGDRPATLEGVAKVAEIIAGTA